MRASEVIEGLGLRASLFGPQDRLFGDPSWTMLLQLYAARERNGRLSVSDVALGSGAPMSTGLRHLARLERHGMVSRKSDDGDGRREWVILSDHVAGLMMRWLAGV